MKCIGCIADGRAFAEFLALTVSLPHLERLGPTYVTSVIAVFRTHARIGAPAGPEPDADEDARTHYAAAAVVPLTELLAARGALDAAPVADWMLAGGADIASALGSLVLTCRSTVFRGMASA